MFQKGAIKEIVRRAAWRAGKDTDWATRKVCVNK